MRFGFGWILLSIAGVSFQLLAQDEVSHSPRGQSGFQWFQSADGAIELFPYLDYSLPPGVSSEELQFTFGSRVAASDGTSLRIVIPSLREEILTRAGQRLESIEVQAANQSIFTQSCADFDLELQAEPSLPAPLYLGIYCRRLEDGSLHFWLSAPLEMNWGEMTLVETAGKGERWREFSLGALSPSTEEKALAEFRFYFESSTFKATLIQKQNADLLQKSLEKQKQLEALEQERIRLELEKQNLQFENKTLKETVKASKGPRKFFDSRLSVMGALVDVKTVNVSEKSYQPAILFDLNSTGLFYTLGLGARVKYVMPPGASNLWDFHTGIQSHWNFNQFKIRPGVSFHNFGNDISSKGLAFRHTSTAVDLFLEYGREWTVWGLLSGSGFLPPGDSQYLSAQIGYRRKFSTFFYWGVDAAYQRVSYSEVDGVFQQILLGGSLSY